MEAASRRMAIIQVPPVYVLEWFLARETTLPQYIMVSNKFIGLPEDCKLRGVHYNHQYDMFSFIVEHESFAEVLQGDMLPILFDFATERTFIELSPKNNDPMPLVIEGSK